jgi:hypothetical protein
MSLLSEHAEDAEDPAGDVTPEAQQPDATPELPKEEPGTRVSVAPKPSRREAQRLAAEEQSKKLDSVLEAVGRFSGELSQRDAQIAELRGALSAYAQRPAPEPARPAAPQTNADDLLEQANALLDKQDFRGYQRKYAEYIHATSPRPEPVQQQAQQPPYMSPQVVALMGQYPDVATHQAGIRLAVIEDAKLAAMGYADGPQRYAAAFEAARATLKGGQRQQGAQFSQQSAAVLSGVPTARQSTGSSGDRGPTVVLTDHEKRWAKAAGMSEEQFARDIYVHHPERRV